MPNDNNGTGNAPEESPSDISSDLQSLESCLAERPLNRTEQGRAAFDSIQSQLGNLRDRLARYAASGAAALSSSGRSPPTEQSSPAASSATAPAPSHQSSSTLRALSERLSRAEFAHSARIPLGLIRETVRRQNGPEPALLEHPESQDEDRKSSEQKQETSNTQQEQKMEISAEQAAIAEDAEDKAKQGRRGRRTSTLLASRARAEELQRMETDISLHEEGYESSLMPSSSEGESAEEPEPMDVMEEVVEQEPKDSVEDLGAPEHPLLLTTKSRERMQKSVSSSSLSGSLHVKPAADTSGSLVYSWGTGINSLHDDALDRNDTKDAKVKAGSRIGRHTVLAVAAGPIHTAVVTASGEVLACGDNHSGQVAPLRRLEDKMIERPSLIEGLSNTNILQVSCGMDHTAALSSAGIVLTWGSNEFGQLGHRQLPSPGNLYRHPAGMVLGPGRRAASVSCGDHFTLVLTSRMSVVGCGSQDIVPTDHEGNPQLPCTFPALEGLPITFVTAGARHAVAVTCHGTAYAWGMNEFGNCGRIFPRSISVPLQIHVPATKLESAHDAPSPFPNWSKWDGRDEPVSLASDVAIINAACGERHTVLVTRSGRLLLCGDNSNLQLGLPSEQTTVSTVEPSYHPDEKHRFVHAEAGSRHSVLLDDDGSVWEMGNGKALECTLRGKRVVAISAGGGQTIALAPGPLSGAMRRQFSVDKTGVEDGMSLAQSVEALLERISKGEDCKELVDRTEELFRYPAVMNSLFMDPTECEHLYEQILSIQSNDDKQRVFKAIEVGMTKGLETLRSGEARLLYPETVRCLLLYLQCPLFRTWKTHDLKFDYRGDVILSLCETMLSLPFEGYQAIVSWATALYPRPKFTQLLVEPLLAQLERGLRDDAGARARCIPVVVSVLKWLHKASDRAGGLASNEDFHSQAITDMNPEALYEDLRRFKAASKAQQKTGFFLSDNPFLMSPTCKRNLLHIEHQVEMVRAATSDLTWDAENHQFVFNPYFVLAIDREYLLTQTMQKIAQASDSDLRKSLTVVFKGEEGVDAGGVTKEFFQLLSIKLFDLNTGMWSTRFEDDITWFNSDNTWNTEEYYLVGVLVGLALYNNVLLDVHFPHAVYRKLLGKPLGLEDVVDRSIVSGLHQLLDYKGDDVEDVFCLNFEVTWTSLGEERSVELKPGGANIPVTSDNREEYVVLYVKWLLVDSVERQYEHFERGVMRVLDGSSLDLLSPEELELLVIGSPELDFKAMEKNAKYEGGYDENSPVVRNFWRFVQNADHDTQLKFLKFSTGSSKAPIGGLGAMPFKVQRAGPDSMQLPTSHTCFNTLLLPDYGDDYAKLEKLLGRAVLECEGFGLQ